MVRIRLKRHGRKAKPFYRVVVIDKRARRQGKPLQELGFYNPMNKELKLDKKAAEEWMAKGAVPTETALRLIKGAPESGELIVLETAKKERLSKKAKAKKEEEASAAAEAKKAAEEAKKQAEEAPVAEETPAEAASEEASDQDATKEEAPADA